MYNTGGFSGMPCLTPEGKLFYLFKTFYVLVNVYMLVNKCRMNITIYANYGKCGVPNLMVDAPFIDFPSYKPPFTGYFPSYKPLFIVDVPIKTSFSSGFPY